MVQNGVVWLPGPEFEQELLPPLTYNVAVAASAAVADIPATASPVRAATA
jgi:hypothetical protein